MVAGSEQFDQPGDILMHKHELLLFSCAINNTSKQYVQYAICFPLIHTFDQWKTTSRVTKTMRTICYAENMSTLGEKKGGTN